MTETFQPGLQDVVAAETRLSSVDGQQGHLTLAGMPVEMLAPYASFEETLYLFWNGLLPDRTELLDLQSQLADRRRLPEATTALLAQAAQRRVDVMEALRMATASLSLGPWSGVDERQDALLAVATAPVIVATYWRMLEGKEPVDSDPSLSQSANFLYMLAAEPPSAERVRALETYLNTVVDHGMNASTFTARVIISTRSDILSAVVGAIGALKGVLHGGAPGPALDLVLEIGEVSRAEDIVRHKLRGGARMMGFGHRVYQVRDPRAEVLSRAARALAASDESRELYELATAIEKVILRLLAEEKPGRPLQTNVEFYTALLLHCLGLPKELFTPTFAIARVVGWTAHCFEQLATGRLMRPRSRYVGRTIDSWVPIDER